MHEVIIVSLRGKVKLFEASGQISLYGESKAVDDTDKTWQRIKDNLNVAPQELSVLVLYGGLPRTPINKVAKFFSDANELQLTDIKSAAESLSLLHGKEGFIFCGLAVRLDKAGEISCAYTEEADISGLCRLSFEEVFSYKDAIKNLRQQLKESRINATRAENKFKTLQKKLRR